MNLCLECGGELELTSDPINFTFKGKDLVASGFKYHRCTKCGEEYCNARDLGKAERAAVTDYKKENNLLIGAEIRAIRESLGMTQFEFEDMLRLGHNTVVRLENDGVFQSPSTDLLIRLAGLIPPSYFYSANPESKHAPEVLANKAGRNKVYKLIPNNEDFESAIEA